MTSIPALAPPPDLAARPAPARPPAAFGPEAPPAAWPAPQAQPMSAAQQADDDRLAGQRLKAQIGDGQLRVSTSKDEATGRTVLRIENRTTGALVEQYPSEKLLQLYAAMRAGNGSLVDQSA